MRVVVSPARGWTGVAEAREQDLGVRHLGDVVNVGRVAGIKTPGQRAAVGKSGTAQSEDHRGRSFSLKAALEQCWRGKEKTKVK